MMHFRDRSTPHPHLEIVSDQRSPNAQILTMDVLPPAIGVFSLDRGLFAESLHLNEWSQMETKDVMGNFSGKAINMNVPLLKSAIYKKTSPAESSPPKGCLSNWSVPSSNFGNVCYTPGYWEWVEDVLPRHKEDLQRIKVYEATKTSHTEK